MMGRADRILEDDREHQKALADTGYWGKQGAGCLVSVKSTNRFLVGMRSPQVDPPNCYSTIGGAIDSNENPSSAGKREFQEETGYSGKILSVTPSLVYKDGPFKYHNFIVTIPDEFKPRTNWETSYFKWVTFTELLALSPKHKGFASLLSHEKSYLQTISS